MIESTFQILPGIGPKKEKSIWESGVLNWDDFLKSDCVCRLSKDRKNVYDSHIEEAKKFLEKGDGLKLCALLSGGEEWRLFNKFRNDVAYLDIETDGSVGQVVTVMTIHRKRGTITLTRGINLNANAITDALAGSKMLVTFNGKCFDVPVLKSNFCKINLNIPHFDLRQGCKKIGLTGGLKSIEKRLNIIRKDAISGMDGMAAIFLWMDWKKNRNHNALRLLTEYNRADTINLEMVADIVYNRLVREYAGFRYL